VIVTIKTVPYVIKRCCNKIRKCDLRYKDVKYKYSKFLYRTVFMSTSNSLRYI